jgi:hypothetical protein
MKRAARRTAATNPWEVKTAYSPASDRGNRIICDSVKSCKEEKLVGYIYARMDSRPKACILLYAMIA